MSAWPSNASRSDAGRFHPEFGYFAPTMRFRSKAWLAVKAVVLGALAGAVAMFFLTMEREEKALTMLATPVVLPPVPPKPAQIAAQTATPSQAAQTRPAATYTWVPVRYLSESMALPSAAPRAPEVKPPLRPSIAAAMPQAPATEALSTVGASPAASAVVAEPAATPEPAAPAAKATAKPKKKIAREPPAPEPEPRHALAGRHRPFVLPIFGFGWQR
jgi:hypothetical protein